MPGPHPTLRVAVTLEQCWHRVPGGTARAALEIVDALVDRGEVDVHGEAHRLELVGVSARHGHPAPAPWTCVDFLSDLHLQAGTPLTTRALIHHVLHTPAHAVFILGDLFEAWVGDELRFEGVERDVTQALREA